MIEIKLDAKSSSLHFCFVIICYLHLLKNLSLDGSGKAPRSGVFCEIVPKI